MRIILACEESQVVTKEFRKIGHEAFSCDVKDCSGGHPEWHLKGSIFDYLDDNWDMLIGFPPCTFLSSVQTHFCRKDPVRVLKRIQAADFFMKLYTSKIDKICIENPTGVMTHIFREADQIIHPYYFGAENHKRTGLWLKNLPKLVHSKTDNLFGEKTHQKPTDLFSSYINKEGKVKNIRSTTRHFISDEERSKLSPFIAQQMAIQWGG